MKASELRDKSVEELEALEKQLRGTLFETRLKNFTNRLDDTSLIPKTKKDLARVKTLISAKAKEKKG